MRSDCSDSTHGDVSAPPDVLLLNRDVVFCIPFRKLLSSTLLRSAGSMFKYSNSVTIVVSTLKVSKIWDRLRVVTGELPALRRAFDRSLLSYVMTSDVRDASILLMTSMVCWICSLTILSLSITLLMSPLLASPEVLLLVTWPEVFVGWLPESYSSSWDISVTLWLLL